jgi:D-aminoacyl-tRNA deacylase
MKGKVAIVCTTADPASRNIALRLLEMVSWTEVEGYRRSGNRFLIVHDERQTRQDGLDRRLEELGLVPDVVVFASRHEAKSGTPWLGGHFTGQMVDQKMELAAAAPAALRSFLANLRKFAPEGFEISAEATHHGPTDVKTPSFFAEIGSTAEQWSDPVLGEAVARSILDLENPLLPVFLGFGGGHYVSRQTSLMFEAAIAFGHLFSSYQVDLLDGEALALACERSRANYAFMDKKSLRSAQKARISDMLQELGLPVLRSKEIRSRFPVP